MRRSSYEPNRLAPYHTIWAFEHMCEILKNYFKQLGESLELGDLEELINEKDLIIYKLENDDLITADRKSDFKQDIMDLDKQAAKLWSET